MYDSDLNSGFVDSQAFDISQQWSDITVLHHSDNGYTQVLRAKRYGKWHTLKCLTGEAAGNPRYQTLLEKEFEIAYQLNHPNIIQTYGIEKIQGYGWCIVQEWIDCEVLNPQLPKKTLRNELSQLCDAITYIHGKGIYHRDIKPENILVEKHTNRVVLIDFGLADKTAFDILKEPAGTTGYSAPEQLLQTTTDNLSDIYSLGKIIQLTGYWKYVADKCTQSLPQKRYPNAEAVKRAINRQIRWQYIVAIVLLIALGAVIYFQQQITRQQSDDILTLNQTVNDYRTTLDTLNQRAADYQNINNTINEYQSVIDTIKHQTADYTKEQHRRDSLRNQAKHQTDLLYIAANISDSLKDEILVYAIARYDSIRAFPTYDEVKKAYNEWKNENLSYSRNIGKKAAASQTGYVAELLNIYSETRLPQTESRVMRELSLQLFYWRRQGRNTPYKIPEYKE